MFSPTFTSRFASVVSRAGLQARFVVLVTLGALAACGGATRGASANRPQYPIGATGEAGAIARARADSLRYPYTDADINFMSGMIHHHAQAIVMARWAPSHGASDELLRLCARVVNAQTDEI
ncbi:MAG: DUF305 domain-containing protein, partial [Gemmatimonadaceae bacterium]